VKKSGADTIFVWDGGESRMATRKNDDGTISFINADPPLSGFEFVRSEKKGKRAIIVRDAQHEYVFLESSNVTQLTQQSTTVKHASRTGRHPDKAQRTTSDSF